MLPEPEQAALLEVLAAELPDLWAVTLFGSFAIGAAREDSDLDLAVFARAPIDSSRLGYVRDLLASRLNRPVDLVDLRNVPLTLAAQILQDGKTLLDSNPRETAFFENVLMSRYCGLNEERKDILQDIRRRGSVYAG